jgi:hypothetical protein
MALMINPNTMARSSTMQTGSGGRVDAAQTAAVWHFDGARVLGISISRHGHAAVFEQTETICIF